MATAVLKAGDRFPAGTSVSAYTRDAWPGPGTSPPDAAAPSGSAVETAVVASDSSLTFTTLVLDTLYYAYASVSSQDRIVAFSLRIQSETIDGALELPDAVSSTTGIILGGDTAATLYRSANGVITSDANLTLGENRRLTLLTNTPGGGISRSIQFDTTTVYDRNWLAWRDTAARLHAALGWHHTDAAEGGIHNAFELKTSADQAGPIPAEQRTRFSIGTDAQQVLASLNFVSNLDVAPGEAYSTIDYGLRLRSTLADGSANGPAAQFLARSDASDNVTVSLDAQPIVTNTNKAVTLQIFRNTNTTSASNPVIAVKKGDGSNTNALLFTAKTGKFELLLALSGTTGIILGADSVATLYRSAAATIKTDAGLVVAGALTLLNAASSTTGIILGGDSLATLYRSAAGVIKTDAGLSIANSGTANGLVITQTGNTSNSTSVGGALNINNTSNTGAGLVIFSNQGSPTGHMLAVRTDNATFNQQNIYSTYAGTGHGVLILHNGTGNASNGLNVVSTNSADTALGIRGRESGRGTIKVTHEKPDGVDDSNASAISVFLSRVNSGDSVSASHGYYLDSDHVVTGTLIEIRNSGTQKLTLADTAFRVFSTVSARFDGTIGFNNTAPIAKPTVTGSKATGAAYASLLAAMASYGLVTDSSTA